MNFEDDARALVAALNERPDWLRWAAEPAVKEVFDQFALRPTESELVTALEESVLASLLFEEGRPTRFVMSLLPGTLPPGEFSSGFVRFERSKPLHRQTLREIAPAAPPETSVICIQRAADSTLQITGILPFARHFGRPVALSFAAYEPGSVTVSFNNRRVMSLRGGKIWTTDDSPLDEQTLVGLLAAHQTQNAAQPTRSLVLSRIIFRAAHLIRSSHHGGSIWVLPPDDEFDGTSNRIESTGPLFAGLDSIVSREERSLLRPELMAGVREGAAENFLREAEEEVIATTLAQLTATDGAVLLDMSPRLRAMSSFIHHSPPDVVNDFINGAVVPRQAHDMGGGRHRSAAAFCGAGGPAARAALVVSQDGAVSLFLKIHHPIPPYPFLPTGVVRMPLSPVGRGFAFR